MSDLISREAVLEEFRRICNACGKREKYNGIMCRTCGFDDGYAIVQEQEPEEPKIIPCKDCKWWDQLEDDHPYGYCRACQSGTHTTRWEISIRRQCRMDFYCADAELKEEENDEDAR